MNGRCFQVLQVIEPLVVYYRWERLFAVVEEVKAPSFEHIHVVVKVRSA